MSHIPKGDLVCLMYNMHLVLFRHAPLRRPRVLSRAFGCGASKGGVGTLRRMSGSRPSTVSVLGSLNVAELALKNKGLLSASPSRVGDMETTTFLYCFFVKSPPPSNTPSLLYVHGFSTLAEEVAAADMQQQQKQQYTPVDCRIYLLHQAL